MALDESAYKYVIAAAMIWLVIPVVVVASASFFDYSDDYTTPKNYTTIIDDLTAEAPSDSGFFGTLFNGVFSGLINFSDFLFGWAAEPVVDAASNFFYSVALLTDSLGVPSWVVYGFITIYSLPVALLLIYLMIELVKAIGGLIPFT